MSLKPDEHLRMAADEIVVEPIQDSGDAVAAAGTPDGGRLGIGKSRHQFLGPCAVVSRQVAARAKHVAVRLDAIAKRLQIREGLFNPFTHHRPGRGDHADRVAMFECFGFHSLHLHSCPDHFPANNQYPITIDATIPARSPSRQAGSACRIFFTCTAPK